MVCADMASLPVSSTHGPLAWLIDDGARLHLQHGPIDLLITAVGDVAQVKAAYRQATQAFQSVLTQLVAELPVLRTQLPSHCTPTNPVNNVVAQYMVTAARPFCADFVTPMIAVAGAVADHILEAMMRNRQLQQVSINNGGDIALYIGSGSSYRIGICPSPDSAFHEDIITLTSNDKVGGVATSGWRGRSHSLGVADAVTVLARTAAMADAAATVIANAVDVPDSPRIHREPACMLNPDSDLGNRLVTVGVSSLSSVECSMALAAGRRVAEQMCHKDLINSAYLKLQNCTVVVSQAASLNEPLSAEDVQVYAPPVQKQIMQDWPLHNSSNCDHRHTVAPFSTVSKQS